MSKTILIVDDSATMRRMVAEVLRGAGYTVLEGCNGEEALRRISDQRIDLVITDFNMPVMNGPALVAQLRARPVSRMIPIVVLTTETDADRKQEGKAAGATGWMAKPFNPAKLLQVVNRLVP